MKGINWKDHAINLFVVILGISIAFYLENWREGRSNQNAERQYIQAIKEDLRMDRDMLDTLITIDQDRMKMLSKLSGASIGTYKHLDSLGLFLAYTQFHVPFKTQKASFEAMTASGNIEIISDFELRSQLFELYGQWYGGLTQYDEAVIQHTNQFIRPFNIHEIKRYSAFKVDPAFVKNPSFVNMIFSYRTLFDFRLKYYQQVLGKVDELIQKIESFEVNRKL